MASKEPNKTLSEEQVIERLTMVKKPEVTNELYEFGQVMVDEIVDRFKSLETKATWLAAYAIGIISLLASTQSIWAKALPSWVVVVLVLSGVSAFGSAASAITALRLKPIPFFSHMEWMQSEYLDNAERLRQYHVLTMHGVHNSYRGHCVSKAARIGTAQALLLLSGLLLVLALANAAVVLLSPVWLASH